MRTDIREGMDLFDTVSIVDAHLFSGNTAATLNINSAFLSKSAFTALFELNMASTGDDTQDILHLKRFVATLATVLLSKHYKD